MTLCAGDILFVPKNPALGTRDNHHYLVATSPSADPDAIVLLCITSYDDYKDDSCVFTAPDCGNPDFIDHQSCIDYHDPIIVPLKRIESLLMAHTIKRKQAFPPEFMERVYQGASESDRIHPKVSLILSRQNLLP